METGMASHAFSALPDKPGTPPAIHALAPKTLSGTVLNAEHAQAQADSGTSNLTIVFAELETGTDHNVLSAQPTRTGTEEFVLLVMVEEFGTLWI